MRLLLVWLLGSCTAAMAQPDTLSIAGLYFQNTTREWVELKHSPDGTWNISLQRPGQPLRPERRRTASLLQLTSASANEQLQQYRVWMIPLQLLRDTLFVYQPQEPAGSPHWWMAYKRQDIGSVGSNKPVLQRVGPLATTGTRPARALLNSLQGTYLLGDGQALVLNKPTPNQTGLWAWAADTAIHAVNDPAMMNSWRAGVVIFEDTQRVMLYVSVPDYHETFALIPVFGVTTEGGLQCAQVAVVPLRLYFGDRPQQLMTLRETRDPTQVVMGPHTFRHAYGLLGPNIELQSNPLLRNRLKNYQE